LKNYSKDSSSGEDFYRSQEEWVKWVAGKAKEADFWKQEYYDAKDFLFFLKNNPQVWKESPYAPNN
jgi:hypothetical protein